MFLSHYFKSTKNNVSLNCCHTEYMVEKLMKGHFYSGRLLYVDNYYNSTNLAHTLLSKDIYYIGTLRRNRKYDPKDITPMQLKIVKFVIQC